MPFRKIELGENPDRHLVIYASVYFTASRSLFTSVAMQAAIKTRGQEFAVAQQAELVATDDAKVGA